MIYPAEFERKMRCIDESASNEEEAHLLADELLCETLRQLGYEKGIDVFERMAKWYS